MASSAHIVIAWGPSLIDGLENDEASLNYLEIDSWYGELEQNILPLNAIAKRNHTESLEFLKREVVRAFRLVCNDCIR